MKSLFRGATFALSISLLTLTSCQNGNMFGFLNHSGDSTDIEVLLADAQVALAHGDYSTALREYEEVLAQDSDNSVALYGAAAAAIGGKGLNIGQLVINIISESASFSDLADAIHSARNRGSIQSTDPNSLLRNIDLEGLDDVIDLAICRLQIIVSGLGDGKIKTDDTDARLNMAILRIVRAALRPIRAGMLDITNVNGNWGIDDTLPNFAGVCTGSPAEKKMVKDLARDVAAAYSLMNSVVQKLHLGNDKMITKMRQDVSDIGTMLLDSGSAHPLDAACITLLQDADVNITKNNFKSKLETFDPPSGC